MRIAAIVLLAALSVMPAAAASVTALFNEFRLFGRWAANCEQPASLVNPYVNISMPSDGQAIEEHDFGADYARNSYKVLSVERVSAANLSVSVIFKPDTAAEERQTLVFHFRKGTRRTIFNRTEGGEVRVKDGIAVTAGLETPLLRKCGS